MALCPTDLRNLHGIIWATCGTRNVIEQRPINNPWTIDTVDSHERDALNAVVGPITEVPRDGEIRVITLNLYQLVACFSPREIEAASTPGLG
jgi:hypothetical protein